MYIPVIRRNRHRAILLMAALLSGSLIPTSSVGAGPSNAEGQQRGSDLAVTSCIDDNDSGVDDCAQSTDGLDRPREVAVSPDGDSVYVVSELDNAVIHFDRDTTTGALTPQGCIDDNDSGADSCTQSTDGLEGALAVTMSPDGSSVYVASIRDHAVVHFDRNTTTGTLTPQGCVDDNDSGADTCQQTTDGLAETGSVVVSPDGTSVYAGGSSDDAIAIFARNPDNGALSPQGCIDDNDTGADSCEQTTDALDFPRQMAMSSDSDFLYVPTLADDAIVILERNPSTGTLTPRGCVDDNDTGPEDCAQSGDGMGGLHAVALSPDGRSLYAASVEDDAIVQLGRDPATGSLTPQGCVDDNDTGADTCAQSTDGLNDTTSLLVSPDGQSVYTTSNIDNAINDFGRASGTGALTPRGCIDDNDTGPDVCAQSTDGLDAVVFAAISPDGGSLYAAAYLDDSIVHLSTGCVPGPDTTCGTPGNDDEVIVVEPGSENVRVETQDGNDRIELQIEDLSDPAAVTIESGDGADTIILPRSSGRVSVTVDAGSGNDVVKTAPPAAPRRSVRNATQQVTLGYVVLGGSGTDAITSGIAGDNVNGGPGSDEVDGAGGSDRLSGAGGGDDLEGGAGKDGLRGGNGNDLLHGGDGANRLSGGLGRDTCLSDTRQDRFESCERIRRNHRRNHQRV